MDRSSVWRPMSEAKKDGTPYLLKFKPMDVEYMRDRGWDHTKFQFKDGFIAVMLNYDNSSSWMFAAPVGCGGFSDDDFVGFRELV